MCRLADGAVILPVATDLFAAAEKCRLKVGNKLVALAAAHTLVNPAAAVGGLDILARVTSVVAHNAPVVG